MLLYIIVLANCLLSGQYYFKTTVPHVVTPSVLVYTNWTN